MQLNTILVLALCYIIGSIPFGLLIGLTQGVDIRKLGSGNIGATNVLRVLGKGPGILVFILDTLKGFFAVWLCSHMHLGDYFVITGGLLSVFGHTFSFFLRFQGGKGVATSLGVIIGLNWVIALLALGIWITIVAITRFVSLGSIIATISVPLMMILLKDLCVPKAYQIFSVVVSIAIIAKHFPNMKRLISGTEPKIFAKPKT